MHSSSGEAQSHQARSDDRGDVRWALAEIAAPVLRYLFRADEVTEVRVSATVEDEGDISLTLWVDALGCTGAAVLWDSTSPVHDASLTDLRIHAADQLQDMIAESPAAWGNYGLSSGRISSSNGSPRSDRPQATRAQTRPSTARPTTGGERNGHRAAKSDSTLTAPVRSVDPYWGGRYDNATGLCAE